MNIILLSALVFSVILSPVAAYATPMEDKIRTMMEHQSKKPETVQNAKDYWCLNGYLNMMAGSALEQRYGIQNISQNQLSDDAKFIENKYSADRNYLLFPKDKYVYFSEDKQFDEPYMYVYPNNRTNTIYVDINGSNPLKMVKAQELLADFTNVILETPITIGHDEHDVFVDVACSITVDDLGIKIADEAHSKFMYKQYVNLRDDIVTVRTVHVDDLLDRGYLSHEAWYQYKLPDHIKDKKILTSNSSALGDSIR